ncbi:MAG: type II toxin-antitoxin system RelE/ParE family toxin [Bacteroidales bacterium]|nr:type II toxin-antitoxin system RelE/ParE family toxin [Bacteroidales bacterium]
MQIEWSEQSRSDLRGILSYVGMNFGRRKAEDVLSDIHENAELLKNFPCLGRVFVKDPELGITYRSLTAKLNKIVYFVDNETITIVTVWQNRQNIGHLKKIIKEK